MILLLLLAVTSAVYLPVSTYPFIDLDDDVYVTQNLRVTGGLSWSGVWWALTTFHEGVWNPLTWLSFMLDHELFGLNPGGYHLHNLFLHLASVSVLFLILRRLTGCLWQSLAVAALFSLHPLNVESVAWVTERKNVLSTLLGFLTIWAYSGYVANPNWRRYAGMFVLFVLGLMAKQMMVTLPCLLLLLDYWPLGRMGKTPSQVLRHFPRLATEKLPLMIPVVAASSLTVIAARSEGQAVSDLEALSLLSRLSNGLVSYALYLKKAVWPSDLSVFYPHPGTGLDLSMILLATLALGGISALVWWRYQDYPYLLVGWLWYLGTLFPVSGLFQVGSQAMADRFTYVPLIGIFIMVVWSASDHLKPTRLSQGVGSAITLAILTSFCLGTRAQLTHWGDSIDLLRQATQSTRGNFLAHNNLGTALLERGEVDAAIEEFSRLLEISPENAQGLYNMGLALKAGGKRDRAREYFLRALDRDPNLAEAHNNVGLLLMAQGHFREARPQFFAALRIDPLLSEAHENLGVVLVQEEELDLAIEHFEKALDLSPERPELYNNLGAAMDLQGRRQEAIRLYRTALKIGPNSYLTLNNLGKALMEGGQLQESSHYLARAVQARPDFTEAHFNLGLVLMRQERFQEAIQSFRVALRLEPRHEEARLHLQELEGLGYKNDDVDSSSSRQ